MSEYVPHIPVSTYVPTDDDVETAFHEFASWLETKFPGEYEHAPEFADWREAMHGFRRWLAAHDAEVAAKAYERAILDVGLNPDLANQLLDTNPYRKAVQS